ncbi:MAG: PASTA domain-containing protein [Candidatus Coatesbacteria bacterium]|nr:PASTA domain-containing protein [Candidatus Coatesbacteria bacterium]
MKMRFVKYLSWFIVLSVIPFFTGLYFFKEIVIPYTNKLSPKAAMPSILFSSIDDANRKVRELELNLKVIERKKHPIFSKDIILEQNPQPNMAIKKGSEVKIVVSDGFNDLVMPDFKNKTQDQLKEFLKNNQLTLISIIYTFSKTTPSFQIESTFPKAGEKIIPGQGILALISLGKFPDITVPEVISDDSKNKAYPNYLAVLKKLKMNPFPLILKAEFTDKNEIEPGSVISQNPAPGTSFFSQTNDAIYPTLILTIKANEEYRGDVLKMIEKNSYSLNKSVSEKKEIKARKTVKTDKKKTR